MRFTLSSERTILSATKFSSSLANKNRKRRTQRRNQFLPALIRGARDDKDIVALRQQPRQHDLARRVAKLLRQLVKLLHHAVVLRKIVALESIE